MHKNQPRGNMSGLSQNIHMLTRPHLPAGATLDSKPEPALLDQLDMAASDKRAGAPGNGASGIPISTTAIALRQDIEFAARDEQYQRAGTDIGTLVAIIQSWATEEDPEMVAYLEHVTLDWCDSINALINPTKPPWRPAVPCPACGLIYDRDGNGPGLRVHCWSVDESMMPPGEWTAECIHCEAAWTPENMPWLARVLEVAN